MLSFAVTSKALVPGIYGASVHPTVTLQGKCVITLCSFVHSFLLSEDLFLPPSSHLPNFYSFSKPSSITISSAASLFTPQAPLISLSEFHGPNVILLLDQLPHYMHSTVFKLPYSPKLSLGC